MGRMSMTGEHNLIAIANYGELMMKNMKRVFVSLGTVVMAGSQFVGDVEVVEISPSANASSSPLAACGIQE